MAMQKEGPFVVLRADETGVEVVSLAGRSGRRPSKKKHLPSQRKAYELAYGMLELRRDDLIKAFKLRKADAELERAEFEAGAAAEGRELTKEERKRLLAINQDAWKLSVAISTIQVLIDETLGKIIALEKQDGPDPRGRKRQSSSKPSLKQAPRPRVPASRQAELPLGLSA